MTTDMMFAVEVERELPSPPVDYLVEMLWERAIPAVDQPSLEHAYTPEQSLMWAPDAVADEIHVEELVEREMRELLGDFVLVLGF